MEDEIMTEQDDGASAPVQKTRKGWKKGVYAVMATAIAVGTFFAGFGARWLTLDPEIRSLIYAKDKIQNDYYEEITNDEFYDAVFGGVNGLLDAYSGYLTPEEYAETLVNARGQQTGVGISFVTADKDGNAQLLVSRVSGNSPAETVGIQAGEYIIGYGLEQDELFCDLKFQAFSDFMDTLSTTQNFYLQIKNPQSLQTRIVTIAKRAFTENYVFYRTNEKAYRFEGEKADRLVEKGEPLSALPQDTAYLRLTKFNGAAAWEFGKAMELFKNGGKKHLVVDLRGNGGGYLHIMQEIAGYFCKNSDENRPIAAIARFNGNQEYVYRVDKNKYDEYFSADSKVYVLADNMSASASECLLGVMVDYGAVDIGNVYLATRQGIAKTYGKGIMQTTFPFIDVGSAIKLTTAHICWPVTKRCIHGVGITPADGAKTVAENYYGDLEVNEMLADIVS